MSPESREQRRFRSRRPALAVLLAACALALAGCSKQSILSTHSPQAHNIMLLWWWMFGVAMIVFLGAITLLGLAWVTRGKPGLPIFGERERMSEGLVLTFGVAIPVVILVALFGVANVYLIKQTSPPSPRSTAMTIDVIGHQWWWEIRYPGTDAVTADEIHIPVDTRVNVVATTADVIHSFWVPALNRKVDMIPGLQNRILLYSQKVGQFRGQCSQFCGLQHAHMALWVFVEPRAAFNAWLKNMAAPARPPLTAPARAGERESARGGERDFFSDGCASCHQLRGTSADGTIGPDLTHLQTRTSLAALTIPNTPQQLASWIRNPQAIKPGDRMPDLGLASSQIDALVAYLEGLK